MPIVRMNHAVLYVRDADVQAEFYERVLGFRTAVRLALGGGRAGVFMTAPASTNDHDIAFFGLGDGLQPSTAGRDQVGLYHVAWEIQTLGELREMATRLRDAGALTGASDHGTTKALYARDPHGLEFEVSWLVPLELLGDADRALTSRPPQPLDLEREIARFGADTPGLRTYPD